MLRAALSERDAMIDEANKRWSSAEEQRLASAAESEALRAHIAASEEGATRPTGGRVRPSSSVRRRLPTIAPTSVLVPQSCR